MWRRAQPRRGAAPGSKRNPRPRAGNGGALVESMRAWRSREMQSIGPHRQSTRRRALRPISYCLLLYCCPCGGWAGASHVRLAVCLCNAMRKAGGGGCAHIY
eukprot:scaffold8298_cov148-Isochrysis_galbana.AAC.2